MNFRRPAEGDCVAGKSMEASGKSWRAHREIKRYAGGSEHRTVADEWMDAAGNGAAADESADESSSSDTAAADESYGSGAAAACAERYDGAGWIAAGSSSSKAD